MYKKPILIAEAGCNHMGSMETAKEIIQTAAIFCKAGVIKFQKRCNRELLTPEQYYAPHPNPVNAYGDHYGAHREFLEFTTDQHRQLKEWCEEYNIIYSTSVWDLTSAKEITTLEPDLIKIPSACNNNFDMLAYLCEYYSGEIHISLGMTTHEEEERIVKFFENKKRIGDVVLYACTSGYPVPFEDTCLLELTRIDDLYGDIVKEIGFSGHHLGIAVDITAYTLGASVIERHFTLNRTWKGTDHAASLEPDGLRRLKRDLDAVYASLTYKPEEILAIEKVQRDKLKWREQ